MAWMIVKITTLQIEPTNGPMQTGEAYSTTDRTMLL